MYQLKVYQKKKIYQLMTQKEKKNDAPTELENKIK